MNDPSPESALVAARNAYSAWNDSSNDTSEDSWREFGLAAAAFFRTHGAHFAAMAARLEDVKAECQLRGDALVVEMSRSERAEAERDAAIAMLREAVPFVGWTGCPDGMIDRICAILGDKGEGK